LWLRPIWTLLQAMVAVLSLPKMEAASSARECRPSGCWPGTAPVDQGCSDACQSPTDRFFDPRSGCYQSPMAFYFEPAFFVAGTGAVQPVSGTALPATCVMQPTSSSLPQASNLMPAAANFVVVPAVSPQAVGFAAWPGAANTQQQWSAPACPAGVVPATSIPTVTASQANASMVAAGSIAVRQPAATAPGGLGTLHAGTGTADPSSQRSPLQPTAPDSRAAQGSDAGCKHACPSAVFVDLSCLREKRSFGSEVGRPKHP